MQLRQVEADSVELYWQSVACSLHMQAGWREDHTNQQIDPLVLHMGRLAQFTVGEKCQIFYILETPSNSIYYWV